MYDADRELVKGIIARDEKALEELLRTYRKPVYQFVLRQINDKNVAEELTQDVFIDFIEALRDFYFQSSLKTYLFAITRNKIIDTIRKKKIKNIIFSSLPSYVVEGLKTVFIDDEIEKKELIDKIHSVFNRLPNEYQLVLRLKYIEGVRVKAIAQKMRLGFKATESLIFRARKAFVKVFEEHDELPIET